MTGGTGGTPNPTNGPAPQPTPGSTLDSAATGRGWSKSRALTVLAIPLAVAAAATSQPWLSGYLADPLHPARRVAAGSSAVPALPALLLAAVAATVALLTTPRVLRAVSAALLTASTLGGAAMAVAVARDPGPALVAAEGGRTTVPPSQLAVTGWLWLAVAALVGAALAGAASWWAGRDWDALAGRFDRGDGAGSGAAGPAAPDLARHIDTWQALSEGRDPTRDPGPGQDRGHP